jgi:hypothetical protein
LAQTEKELEEVLYSLPETAEDAYKRAFSRCIGEETKRRILHIILAAQRSLTLMEINVAREVDETLKQPNDSASLSLLLKNLDSDVGKTRIAVQDACGLFINIVDSRVFLSRTAKEFLLREIEESSRQRRWTNSINIRNAHRVLSRICVTYLLLPEIQNYSLLPFERVGDTCAFLDYAASHLIHHGQEACDDDTNWIRQTLKLCDLEDGLSRYWYKVYSRSNGLHYYPSDPQPKQIWAVVFGLINVLQSLRGSKVNHSSLASSTTNLLGDAAEDGGHDEDYLNSKKHEITAPNFRPVVEKPLHWLAIDIPVE